MGVAAAVNIYWQLLHTGFPSGPPLQKQLHDCPSGQSLLAEEVPHVIEQEPIFIIEEILGGLCSKNDNLRVLRELLLEPAATE